MHLGRNSSLGGKFLRGVVMAICLAMVAVTYTATFTQEINAGGGKKKKGGGGTPPPSPPPPPPGGGGGAAGCEIARGQDSLDILSAGIRHNVWFVLDSSGSMGGGFGNSGLSKMDAAKEIMKLLMSTLVDASGSPLVNWGYFPYSQIAKGSPGANNRDKSCPSQPLLASEDTDGDGFMDHPGDCGGLDPNIGVFPVASACGQNNLQNLLDAVDLTFNYPGTPLGIAFDQIGDNVANNGWVDGLEPGQRNFIIHMTDGKDDCECQDFQYEDGSTSVDIRGGSAGPEVTFTSNDSKYIRTFNASMKAEKTLKQIDPDLDGSKGNIFMVGMGLGDEEKEKTHHLAWMGSGARLGRDRDLMSPAFFGDDVDELVAALMEVLGIVSTPITEVSLGQSVVGSVKELIPLADSTITSGDLIADTIAGSLDKDDTDEARKIRNQYPNNVLFATSVVTPEWEGHLKAFNIYKVVNKGTALEKRVADYSQIWDAGVELRDVDPDDRSVLFNRLGDAPGSYPSNFNLGGVQASDLNVAAGFLAELDGLGATTDADAAEIIIRVIRGERLEMHSVNGLYQDAARTVLNFSKFEKDGVTKTWKLYDPTNIGPTVVLNPPRSPDESGPLYHAAEYGSDFNNGGFYWDHINRLTVVYMGTNGGPMHAFRGDNGAELYAYVPGDLLPKLRDFVRLVVAQRNGFINHEFMIAASASVEDAFFQTDQSWHTILAFGRGQGGKHLTALDVSNAPDWDGTSSTAPIDESDLSHLPRLRFTVGNIDGVVDSDGQGENYDGFGETWSIPVIGAVAEGVGDRAVLFMGSGYGCVTSDEGRYFYVLDLEDGTVYKKFGPINDDAAASIDDNAMVATPTLFWHQDLVTRVYIGDLQGVVHKLDTSNADKAQWTFNDFYSMGVDQPIAAPIALFVPDGAMQIQLFVGTGGDKRASLPPGQFFKLVGLLDADMEGQNSPGSLMSTPTGTFVVDLPDNERIFVSPVTAPTPDGNGAVFFASSAPGVDLVTCTNIFTSTLFGFGATTGAADFDMDESQSGSQSSTHVGNVKVTGLFHREGHLYVSKSGGLGVTGSTEVRGSDEFPKITGGSSMGNAVSFSLSGYRFSPF